MSTSLHQLFLLQQTCFLPFCIAPIQPLNVRLGVASWGGVASLGRRGFLGEAWLTRWARLSPVFLQCSSHTSSRSRDNCFNDMQHKLAEKKVTYWMHKVTRLQVLLVSRFGPLSWMTFIWICVHQRRGETLRESADLPDGVVLVIKAELILRNFCNMLALVFNWLGDYCIAE